MDEEQWEAEIGRLQAEIAFQGDSVQRLNDALAAQQGDILMLQRQLALLAEQLRTMRENNHPGDTAGDASGDNEKPPHY